MDKFLEVTSEKGSRLEAALEMPDEVWVLIRALKREV